MVTKSFAFLGVSSILSSSMISGGGMLRVYLRKKQPIMPTRPTKANIKL